MRLISALALLLALTSPSLAQQAPSDRTNATEYSNEQAYELLDGLKTLDGHQVIIRDGAKESAVMQPYTFGGGLLLVIAGDIAKLHAVTATFEAAKRALVMQASKGTGQIAPGSPEWASSKEQLANMLAEKQPIELRHIKAAELNLEKNPIPPSVLALLEPILDQ